MLTSEEKVKKYDEMVKARKKYYYRHFIRTQLVINKAVKAGYVVTDAEVDAEIKRRAKK